MKAYEYRECVEFYVHVCMLNWLNWLAVQVLVGGLGTELERTEPN